jgi:hypothetical protein
MAIQSDREPSKEKLDSIEREFGGFDKVRFTVLRSLPQTEAGTEKVRGVAEAGIFRACPTRREGARPRRPADDARPRRRGDGMKAVSRGGFEIEDAV